MIENEGDAWDYFLKEIDKVFEILDFNNLELTGESRKYLQNYVNSWEETFLGDFFKRNEND